MVTPRGNLIDGDWKLTKSVDAAQKKNAKASDAWARATASAKGKTLSKPRPRPSGHQWAGQKTSTTGKSSGGSSKYSSGDEARNAYVESLRAQSAIRAAEERRVVQERRRSDKPRPGLPMTGGGDEKSPAEKTPAEKEREGLGNTGKRFIDLISGGVGSLFGGKSAPSNDAASFDALRKQ